MSQPEMPIFTRSFDFLTGLLPATNHFPRAQRHTVTRRLLDAAFELREQLESANHRMGTERMAYLNAADEALDRVRLYLRLAAKWDWLSPGQYQHAAKMVAEIGRLWAAGRRSRMARGGCPCLRGTRPRPARAAGMYQQLCSWENLLLAYRKAAKGKRGHALGGSGACTRRPVRY